jgi:carbon-monoxide dehydrogenase iron sulfur subunit
LRQILTIDIEKCTGCRNCELACSAAHTNTFNPKRSRIQILKDEVRNLIVPMVCLQCENPLCKEACPNGAIVQNNQGTLYVDHNICIGCLNCVTACVYGGIAMDPATKKAVKCNLCDGDPACVKACEYGAISLSTSESEGLHQRRQGVAPVIKKLGIEIEEVP